MKARLLIVFMVTGLALTLVGVMAALGTIQESSSAAPQDGSTALTLRLSIGSGDALIDPAIATTGTHIFVTNQLFAALVRLDDETSEPLPALASSWEMSSDGKMFTFTLRSDVYWTDGKPVTASDVRYGILRTLAPDTSSVWTYMLYVIQNAEEYNNGTITDPNQVGVTVLDNTHLRFTLNQAAAYLPSILAEPFARPMPQWAIEAHGTPTWTFPANIVTNGPYKLTGWTHGVSMTLEKNAVYPDALNVQIERVMLNMVDDATAWGMYQAGQLDSALVPSGGWITATNTLTLEQELHKAPVYCTYYYGFNITKSPFTSTLVRKAFIAALDRQGVISNVLRGPQKPALTYTPQGMFGYVDGAAEGVGVPYDAIQARQWLTDAGYPNGEGLPPVTLWYNTSTGHQAIAQYVRQNWIDNLGVTVTLAYTTWNPNYQNLLRTNPPQVWRYGWCLDYRDAYDFLEEGINHTIFGNWNNATYNNLLIQASQTADLNTRKSLYKQAEEILVETDAVMIPIYHYDNGVAAKPYLERTYSSGGNGGRIADWRIRVSQAITTGGGSLTSYTGDTTVTIPPDTFTETVVITQESTPVAQPGGNLASVGDGFDITAIYSDTGEPAQPAPGQTYTITVQYTDAERSTIKEDTLALYWWDGNAWSQQGITSTVDTIGKVVTAQVDHLSTFAVLGETHRVFLPIVMRSP
jgi:oligopeptide transport system substrate-binding protein